VRWHDTAFESLASRLVAASTFRLVNAVHVAVATQDPEGPLRHALKTERFSVATPFHAGRISAAFSSCHHLGNNLFRTAPMKSAFSLLVLIATIGLAHAGGFGGPPPFTNGSPLTTGVAGTYQASARGSNLSGVISFTYSGGVQTNGSWVVFYEGQVYSGGNTVAINDGSIAGVLETATQTPVDRTFNDGSTTEYTVTTFSGSTTSTTNFTGFEGGGTTTAALVNPSGYFNATLDNNSPTGSFNGKGELSTVIQIDDGESTFDFTVTPLPLGSITESSQTNAGDTTTQTVNAPFKVKGVRATITAS